MAEQGAAASSSTTPSPIRTSAERAVLKMQEEYSSDKAFIHINTRSTVTSESLSEYRSSYHIPINYETRVPFHNEKMYMRPDGWIAVSVYAFKYGVRFPLHPFIFTLLGFLGIGLAQLVPNSFIHIISFIAFCEESGISPTLDFFFVLFLLGRSRESGFRQINKQASKGIEKRALIKPPSSNKGWHSLWFFIRGPDCHNLPDWAEASRTTTNVTFDEITEERLVELKSYVERLPSSEWELDLLSNQEWLFRHNCKLILPAISPFI